MANRFIDVGLQYVDDVGNPLSGGKLRFFVTGSSTPAPTYYDPDLAAGHEAPNPITLDSAGRPPTDVCLDPNISYRVVLTNSSGSQTFWIKDQVSDPAANVVATFRIYAGNPNGFVSGNAGAIGGSGASTIYDITGQRLFVCTTSGSAATAVWKGVAGNNPLFTTIDVGAADTTIARASAGVISVEGKNVYMAGGADVATMDGGTGGSFASLTAAVASVLSAALDSAFGSTQGMILYRGSSGWAALATGTDSHQLTTHGAGANPTWTAPGTGGGF
jgi:hypothetical protein